MQNYLPACKIVSTHGVRGEMKALPLCDGAQFLAKFKRLYAAANGSGEVALRGVRAQGNMLLVKLAGVEDMDAARAQVGKTYYFAKADAKLPEGRYFIDDLIGCTVLHADDGRTLGVVAKVDHPGVQDIYIVRDAAGEEHWIPAVPEFVVDVDIAARTVAAVLASGLFFGLFHGNLNQFSYAFLLGLFLGFIYVKTGKLGYTIGLHMAINFIGSSLGTWMLRVTGYMDTMETLTEFLNTRNLTVLGDLGNGMVGMFIFGSYASLILMMAGAGLILMWLNRKKFVCCAPAEKVASLGKKKVAVMIGNPGILLYGAFWIGIMIWQLLQ